MDNLRSTIATKILSNIPPRIKPIEYLMKSLNISRESVYRRIRGDISFTLEEIAKLSVDLGFSIDELIIEDMHSRIFFDIHTNNMQDPSDIYITIMSQYFQCAFDISQKKYLESIQIINQISPGFIIFFDYLLKFSYYRWMHQHQESSLKYFYSDVVMPKKLISMQQDAIESFKKGQNNTIILDPDLFMNLIRAVQYYYKRKLITDDEFIEIKKDLLGLIDMLESIAQTGIYGSEAKYNIYLSSLNIEACSRYIKCEDHVRSLFYVNSMEPVIITDSNLCAMHKKWLDSMRKYATLITQSNEILQVRYFNKQRSHIMKIEETANTFSI